MEKVKGSVLAGAVAIVLLLGLTMPGLQAEGSRATATLVDTTGAEVGVVKVNGSGGAGFE